METEEKSFTKIDYEPLSKEKYKHIFKNTLEQNEKEALSSILHYFEVLLSLKKGQKHKLLMKDGTSYITERVK